MASDQGEGGSSDSGENESATRGFFQKRWIKYAAVLAVIVLIAGAIVWWLHARRYESTDDAYISAHIVYVSPQVSGKVVRVSVDDNEKVTPGQLLVQIDPSVPKARMRQILAQETAAKTRYNQAVAKLKGAKSQFVTAKRQLERYRRLRKTPPAPVTQSQVDTATTKADNAQANFEAAQQQVAGAKAKMKGLDAQATQARIDLAHTTISAPVAGHVANKTVATGNFVSPGTQLMAIVPLHYWVKANFKETQLAEIRVGQPVSISIDACPDHEAHGKVESIQRGAGQAFQLLPAQNATGNFVKVVQRVPVKITLDDVPPSCTIGPGMSVVPSVTVR